MELFLYFFIITCMFIIGSLFGSFFSLATYRIPRHQDIIATRSYCPNCKHKLNFFDLIPVISYIIRGGKCKYCHDKISLRYFLLEVINGTLFVILYFIFGYTLELLFICLIYSVIFVMVGSIIMNKNMINSELDENIVEEKLVNKKGVFISELIIAMLLFIALIITSYVVSRNYEDKFLYTNARSNAIKVATDFIELAIATDYDTLDSYSKQITRDNINYLVNVNVSKYSEEDASKIDIIKKINVIVRYNINGTEYVFKLNTLKDRR